MSTHSQNGEVRYLGAGTAGVIFGANSAVLIQQRDEHRAVNGYYCVQVLVSMVFHSLLQE